MVASFCLHSAVHVVQLVLSHCQNNVIGVEEFAEKNGAL